MALKINEFSRSFGPAICGWIKLIFALDGVDIVEQGRLIAEFGKQEYRMISSFNLNSNHECLFFQQPDLNKFLSVNRLLLKGFYPVGFV